jgi:hypothetical protein
MEATAPAARQASFLFIIDTPLQGISPAKPKPCGGFFSIIMYSRGNNFFLDSFFPGTPIFHLHSCLKKKLARKNT